MKFNGNPIAYRIISKNTRIIGEIISFSSFEKHIMYVMNLINIIVQYIIMKIEKLENAMQF